MEEGGGGRITTVDVGAGAALKGTGDVCACGAAATGGWCIVNEECMARDGQSAKAGDGYWRLAAVANDV